MAGTSTSSALAQPQAGSGCLQTKPALNWLSALLAAERLVETLLCHMMAVNV